VQACVEGQTTTTVALADEGDVRAYFQERRLRTVPPSGGSSALLGVVDDDRMLSYAERIIAALSWTGPIQVEFMERPDGDYTLIEVNGRYWGSLPLAINCGVDIPWLHYRQLLGEEVYHSGTYRTDVRQRRTAQDVDWLKARLAAGHFTSLVPFVLDIGRADHTFVSLSDPLPTAWVLAQGPRLLVDGLVGLGRSVGEQVLPSGRIGEGSRGPAEASVGASDVDRGSSADGE
jgi:predicted ATP-grasp superfamily ATP-dependent carboligase